MDKLELAARDFAYSLARTYMGTYQATNNKGTGVLMDCSFDLVIPGLFSYFLFPTVSGLLLVEHASWAQATPQDVLVAQR